MKPALKDIYALDKINAIGDDWEKIFSKLIKRTEAQMQMP